MGGVSDSSTNDVSESASDDYCGGYDSCSISSVGGSGTGDVSISLVEIW